MECSQRNGADPHVDAPRNFAPAACCDGRTSRPGTRLVHRREGGPDARPALVATAPAASLYRRAPTRTRQRRGAVAGAAEVAGPLGDEARRPRGARASSS